MHRSKHIKKLYVYYWRVSGDKYAQKNGYCPGLSTP